MFLRDYQQDASDAVFDRLTRTRDNPLCVMPTGSGKSVVMADIIRRAVSDGARVVVFAHVKELVAQNHAAFCNLCPDLAHMTGVYSAGLGLKQARRQITFAGIQSIARNPGLLGKVNLALVDEAHMVPQKGDGQYRSTIDALQAENPRLRVVGMTATPYRLGDGLLTTGPGKIFDSVAYECDIVKLISDGWLAPLVPRQVGQSYNTDGVKRVGGDFQAKALAERIDSLEDVTRAACAEMTGGMMNRRAALIFCASVRQAEIVRDELAHMRAALVTGETPNVERDRIVRNFKTGHLRCIVNVGVFTTGFDAPNVDFLGVLRPTQSTSLYVQIMGRGMRTHPDKKDGCLVYDYGENVARHGPINKIEIRDPYEGGGGDAPFKLCPSCKSECRTAVRICPTCEHRFPPPETKLETRASSRAIVDTKPPEWRTVRDVQYSKHVKKKEDGTESVTLRVDYMGTLRPVASEWVCIQHEGFAGKKAAKWVDERLSEDGFPPLTVDAAIKMGEAGDFKEPIAVQVGKEGKYDRIVGYKWDQD